MGEELAAQLLTRLWELQAEAGLSDAALARELGYSHSTISRYRSGERGKRLSLEFAQRAAARFTELNILLSPESPIGNDESTKITDQPQEGASR